jgi:glycosyltransferase involved in cell wall biosynthesis
MRVCHVTNLGWPAGGAEKSIQMLRDGLVQRGHSVLIVATDKGAGSRTDVFADVLIPQISGGALRRLRQYFFYGAAYRELRRQIKSFRPDIVHLHTVGELSPAAVFALWGMPFVMTVHGPEEFTRALIPWILPASDYRNATYRRNDLRVSGRLRSLYLRVIQRPAYLLALRRCDAVVAPSLFIARTLELDVDPGGIVHIDNGVDIPDVVSAPPGRGRFLFVGRLEAVKGVDVLLRAFARARQRCPGITLTIAGDGAERNTLEALAARLELAPDVTFLGRVEPDEVARNLADSDVLVTPSVWPEAFGLVIVEAMGVGRAVLASGVGAIPELVAHGVSGLITDPYDEAAMAAGMVQLASQPDLCRQMGEAGRTKAASYAAEIFMDNVLDLYDRTVREAS